MSCHTLGGGTVATLAPAINQKTIAEIPHLDPRARVQEAKAGSQIEDDFKSNVKPSNKQLTIKRNPMVAQPNLEIPLQDVNHIVIMMSPPMRVVQVLNTRAVLVRVSTFMSLG